MFIIIQVNTVLKVVAAFSRQNTAFSYLQNSSVVTKFIS